MDRDTRLRVTMRELYDKLSDAALQLDTATVDQTRLEGELEFARQRHRAAETALARTRGAGFVSASAYREQRDALKVAATDVAAAEGWLLSRRAEVAAVRERHDELDARYNALAKELDSSGADVIKFPGHPNAHAR